MTIDNKTVGIIGLLSILAIFGGVLYLTPEQLENTYICNVTQEIGIFYGGISSSGLTAYPYKENRTGYKRCTNGIWINLKDYIKENNVSIEELLIREDEKKDLLNNMTKSITIRQPNGKVYFCEFASLYSNNSIESRIVCNI